jgi:hypothetical protein
MLFFLLEKLQQQPEILISTFSTTRKIVLTAHQLRICSNRLLDSNNTVVVATLGFSLGNCNKLAWPWAITSIVIALASGFSLLGKVNVASLAHA